MEKNTCDKLYIEYNNLFNLYELLSKKECVTNSCKRNKEKVYGDLDESFKKLFNCRCIQYSLVAVESVGAISCFIQPSKFSGEINDKGYWTFEEILK